MIENLPKYMQNLTNIKNATCQQLSWLMTNRCTHRHNYVRHFGCFLKDFNIKERVCFLDIETSNLKANFGIVLAWCVLGEDGLQCSRITKEDVDSGFEDKRLIVECIKVITTFDRIVGHYSTYFDVPFLRTRALIHGLKFPELDTLYHTDVWKMAKTKLCLHSNRQDVIAESLYGKTEKTRISHPAWRKAMMGNEAASKEVLSHCQHDVQELKKNFNTLLPYCKLVRSSI